MIHEIIDIPVISKYLGEWDKYKMKIVLYDVPIKESAIIKDILERVTKKFKYIVLSPEEKYTNINILDINL